MLACQRVRSGSSGAQPHAGVWRARVAVICAASALGSAVALGGACVSTGEQGLRADLQRAGAALSELPDPEAPRDPTLEGTTREGSEAGGASPEAGVAPDFDGRPQAYVDFALTHDPRLRAAWERWRAATHRVARERRLPMPTLTYAVFVSQVETRVGPQRQRLGLRQRFPWPGALLAGADAAVAEARVLQRDFEARALEVRAEVLRRYWALWLLRVTRSVDAEELELYVGLAELARARLEGGRATLAELQQLDLQRARLADELEAFGELEIQAQAQLRAALGVAVSAHDGLELPTVDALPALETPDADEASLRASLDDHPLLLRWQTRARASSLREREARRARGPGMSVGVDWIEVGPARASGVADSGKDAVSVSLGIELPLWQRNYAEDEKAAAADAAAARSEREAARQRAAADLSVVLASLRDSARRIELHENTLVPQARGALESVVGHYAGGEGELSEVFFAQRQLLDLRVTGLRLHAAHAVAWAELERIVGQSVEGHSAVGETETETETETGEGPHD